MPNLEKSKNITEIDNTEKLTLQVIQLGFNDDRSVEDTIAKTVSAENKRIDVSVNNAGYLLLHVGFFEDLSLD
jgi:NADP-dependent 3-hydroxy acid dehydrogenase YdfG